MKILTILILVASLLYGSGCKSQQGYIAVVDFDFRKAAQLEAGAREAEAPYKNWTSTNTISEIKTDKVTKESLPIAWWKIILNAISKLECRVTLLQIRWGGESK